MSKQIGWEVDDIQLKKKEFNFRDDEGNRIFIFRDIPYRDAQNLKHIKFDVANYLDVKNALSVIINEKYAKLYSDLMSLWDRSEDLYVFISRWQTLFAQDNFKFNLMKFRGDFAELMFLKKYGGIKKIDTAESDIMLNEIQYEVKSISNHSYNMTISHRQLTNDIPVVLFILKESNENSYNIIELADELRGKGNDDFIDKIIKKYNHVPFTTNKFMITDGKLFEKPIEAKTNDKFFKSASYVVNCKWNSLDKLKF